MREAHVPHHLLRVCVAKPRQQPVREGEDAENQTHSESQTVINKSTEIAGRAGTCPCSPGVWYYLVIPVAVAVSTTAAATAAWATSPVLVAVAATATATSVLLFAALTGFVDDDGAVAKGGAVELLNGGTGFLVVAHLDEAEAFAAAGVAVDDYGCRKNLAYLAEEVRKVLLGRSIGQTAYVDSHCDMPPRGMSIAHIAGRWKHIPHTRNNNTRHLSRTQVYDILSRYSRGILLNKSITPALQRGACV